MRLPLRRGTALALALVLLTASVASAHPSFNPNQLPAGEAVDAVLVVPHGCDPEGGMPEDGGASPTVVLDLQLAPEVTAFETHEIEGWEVKREQDVVSWTATDGGTTDPIQLPVTLTVDGPVGEPIYLSAFQECEEGSFRWIGTPDDEAEYPAVKLTPTEGQIGAESPDDGHVGAEDEHGEAGEDGHGEAGEDGHDGGHPDAPTATDGAEDATVAAGERPPANDPEEDAAGDRGSGAVIVTVVVLALLAGAGLVWARRSRGSGT